MGLLDRIGNWLTASNISLHHKGHPDLYPIDVAKLTKELNLIEEAKRLGEAGVPAPDATTPSGPESAAIQRVEKARQDYVDWAVVRLSVISRDMSKQNITEEINRAHQADKEFERKVSTLLTERENLLRKLVDIAMKSKAELEVFRSKHGLKRDAHFPTGARAFLQIAVIVILIVFEGFLNATFFAQGLDTGLIGGALQAMTLAAINVFVAYFFGRYAVRYINHIDVWLRVLGYLSLFTSIAIIVTIGLGIAHYRDALTSEMTDSAKVALQTLLAHPVQLRDFFSWALFLISALFGLISLIDGLFNDDLYPGYGAISRRTKQAIEDYEEELETLREELEELKNDELRVLEQTVRNSQGSVVTFASLIEDKQATKSRLMTALLHADQSLYAILNKFRTENEMHRKGLPRPSYYNILPSIKTPRLPDFSTNNDEVAFAEMQELVNVLLSDVQNIRARIQAAFSQQFDQLRPLDIHFFRREQE